MNKIYLKPKKEENVLRFHPWIFSGAIHSVSGRPQESDLVRVVGYDGTFLAIGHYQIGSIMVRVLTFEREEIDLAFFKKRLRAAYDVRQSVGLIDKEYNNTYRLVHGEGDYLPGLIIDIYDKNQSFARAMNVTLTPQVYVADKDGKIVYSHTGYTPGSELELIKKIKELQAGK